MLAAVPTEYHDLTAKVTSEVQRKVTNYNSGTSVVMAEGTLVAYCSLQHPDSLRAERSGDRIPMAVGFSAPVQIPLVPYHPPVQWVPYYHCG